MRRPIAITLALALLLAAPAAASAAFGAIAVNRATGAWGVSYRAPAKRYAERLALRKCAGNCSVLVWVENRCAAVVIGRTAFVAGMGATKARAIHSARHRAHDGSARVLAWTCSG